MIFWEEFVVISQATHNRDVNSGFLHMQRRAQNAAIMCCAADKGFRYASRLQGGNNWCVCLVVRGLKPGIDFRFYKYPVTVFNKPVFRRRKGLVVISCDCPEDTGLFWQVSTEIAYGGFQSTRKTFKINQHNTAHGNNVTAACLSDAKSGAFGADFLL